MLNYDQLKVLGNTTEEIKTSIKENRLGDDMYYNEKIREYLKQIHKYKRFNKKSYEQGIVYMRKYFRNVSSLERIDIERPKHSFEDAKYYLDQAINHFQMITTSLPESTFNTALKYNDFSNETKSVKLGKICKALHQECYFILWNLSIKLNETTWKNPDVYKDEIRFNSDHVFEYDSSKKSWDLY
jgi:hypothetical protein|tara:strand:- start:37 stop:591 length:555 start_codon:yes stop_codon:yes gene_type:complete